MDLCIWNHLYSSAKCKTWAVLFCLCWLFTHLHLTNNLTGNDQNFKRPLLKSKSQLLRFCSQKILSMRGPFCKVTHVTLICCISLSDLLKCCVSLLRQFSFLGSSEFQSMCQTHCRFFAMCEYWIKFWQQPHYAVIKTIFSNTYFRKKKNKGDL